MLLRDCPSPSLLARASLPAADWLFEQHRRPLQMVMRLDAALGIDFSFRRRRTRESFDHYARPPISRLPFGC
jgi:hypothetical protein